ncbi:MAG: acyl-CoA dehydrogenase family protein [Nitrososphaerota archaeon]|nr:acyl-CoA dehydrogenase family protein [Nitrososphaerota archaeon]MDG6967012.1 acyl-CoA dehydrogenase family protein [Nitrososphaerota archaeon]MDG6979023.1 acyl-CoA dehydrogenase family protein [Nitrososphaerota archaeon]MDG7020466.1 acyl-CoA dehydrogenase family protein [Nitrososphaerota archaeon]
MTGLPAIGFSPEHEELRSWARDFAKREVAPVAEKMDRTDEYPRELARKMGEHGLLGIGTPKEYGGLGLDIVSSVVVAEEIAKVSLSAGLIIGVQNGLVGYPISQFGTPEQKEKYLPRLASGELVGSYGLTEPGAGSDAANIQTRAEKAPDGSYKITGSKMWISQGLLADAVVLFTRTGSPDDGAAGITAFLVDRGTPGFRVGGKLEVIGMRGTGTAELVFDGCEVPGSSMLGSLGDGFLIAMSVLNQGRIGAAAAAVGVASAALEASIEYSKKRSLFGRPLGKFESIRFMMADMATRIEAARLLTYRAAYLRDRGDEFVKEASMAKVFSTETAVWAAERAIQIHGGIGLSKLLPLERYLRDAKILDIVEGTSEVQRWILSREILQD